MGTPKAVVAAFVLCAGTCALAQEDIYINYYTPGSQTWSWVMHDISVGETGSAVEISGGLETEARVGQLVTFAGTSRFVTELRTQVYFPSQFSGQRSLGVTASIREVAGGIPGALIWSGRTVAASAPASGHVQPVVFTPNVTVPDSVILTLEYDSIAGESGGAIGMLMSDAAPTVGNAGDQLLSQDSLTLEWYAQVGLPAPLGLQAIVRAQPAPACYANCDASTAPPVLNVLDFNCFVNRFGAGDSYANCDGSTVPPVLNILDFNCFINRFTAGCP